MKILLFFHGGSRNRGCEAIVRTAVKVIKNKYNNAYIALASTRPETDKEIDGLDEIIFHNQFRSIKRFSFSYFQNFFETRLKKENLTAFRLMHQDVISRIDDFDMFLSIGGDNYCYGDIPDYYELNRKIKAKGKKLVLWGASVGKEDVEPNKLIDLKSFDKLFLRESNSYNDLKNLGLKNIELVADGAFVLDKEFLSLPEKWQEGNTIGFNYSPLIFKRHPESRQAAKELLQYILEKTNYQIAFTPHVIIPPGNDDYQCMKELMNELDTKFLNRIFLLPDNLNALQYKGYIARMEMFIGARTHATIAAYSSKVPTMVLGYSIKSLGIAKDIFGYERLVLDKSEISNSKLMITKFEELQKDKEEIKAILETKIPEVQKLSFSAANYL